MNVRKKNVMMRRPDRPKWGEKSRAGVLMGSREKKEEGTGYLIFQNSRGEAKKKRGWGDKGKE